MIMLSTFIYVLVLCSFSSASVSAINQEARCEKGWVRFNETCYYFGSSKVNWWTAAEMCYNRNSHLAVISSKIKSGYLKAKVIQFKGGYWIDASDLEKEGVYRWTNNGKLLTVTDWYKGQPKGGVQYSCVIMYAPTQGKWHDSGCSTHKYKYICEKELKRRENNNYQKYKIALLKLKTILDEIKFDRK